ncbi:2Fe-2S iron-sulfur cluster binding domain-containing protein [Hyphomicrobium sp.]|uniref:2Fe-2S iron-sulfur cluster binding domain-containing protein n=1 Tax=Hyphomicrobium sp. TaxID=82 RepID=UPI002FDEFDCE
MSSSLARAERPETSDTPEADKAVNVTIETPTGRFEFKCDEGETLLRAGLRQGVTLPYECATGTCGTCRGRTMTGNVGVGWADAPALAKLKQDKGDILLCQARATSDCLVRVPSKSVAQTPTNDAPMSNRGIITSSRRLTRDVIEFTISLAREMSFEAGQFMLVSVGGVIGARAYSMVNYAPDTDEIVFVVKRKDGGGFCDWLFESEVDGAKVELFGPLGRATLGLSDRRNLIIAGGGSGIAGMMAILERATQTEHFASYRGRVFFGVQKMEDGFYLEELADYVQRAGPNLEVTLALSNDEPPAAVHPEFPSIRLAKGYVHEAMSAAMSGLYDNDLAFIGGPPPMVDAVLRTLIVEGQLTPASIRYDKFS